MEAGAEAEAEVSDRVGVHMCVCVGYFEYILGEFLRARVERKLLICVMSLSESAIKTEIFYNKN